ncbi:MAG: hypothetical protein OCD00_08295 [Colwellia sp.]
MNINTGFIDIDYSSMSDHALVAARTKNLISIHGNIIWSVMPNFDIGFEHSIAELKLLQVIGKPLNVYNYQPSTTSRYAIRK